MTEEAEARRAKLQELQTKWLSLNDEQRAALVSIAHELEALGPKACSLLKLQAKRLAVGASYGDFERGRDWRKETLEEVMDGLHYVGAALLEARAEDEKKAAE